jgi:hypothetical protein
MTDRQHAIVELLQNAIAADLSENQIGVLLVSELLASHAEVLEAIAIMHLEAIPATATRH